MITKSPRYYSRVVVPPNHGHWCIMGKQLFGFIRQRAFLLLTQFGIWLIRKWSGRMFFLIIWRLNDHKTRPLLVWFRWISNIHAVTLKRCSRCFLTDDQPWLLQPTATQLNSLVYKTSFFFCITNENLWLLADLDLVWPAGRFKTSVLRSILHRFILRMLNLPPSTICYPMLEPSKLFQSLSVVTCSWMKQLICPRFTN